MKSILSFLLFTLFSASGFSQVRLLEITHVTDSALYFNGKKNVAYHFGDRITPHGNCLDAVNGYIYIAWYKGGMKNRNVMLSRKKIEGGQWKTIQFPDKHIGYRGDSTLGDSHNTIAIGISTIDQTVHLLYDMHAYDAKNFPGHYFNYRVSKKGGAVVEDKDWNISLFSDKLNYLKKGVNYEMATYPQFIRNDEGAIYAHWRNGGSGSGNEVFAKYDGKSWSDTRVLFIGKRIENEKAYSVYGDYKFLNGYLTAGFSIRYDDFTKGNPKYELNTGLFYAKIKDVINDENWLKVNGEKDKIPVKRPETLQFADPLSLGLGKRMSSGPSWTVTKSGVIHFIISVNNTNVHYYKTASQKEFTIKKGAPSGSLYSIGDKIYLVGLQKGKPIIQSAKEGTNDWKIIYQTKDKNLDYKHGNSILDGNKLVYFLMKEGKADALPLDVLVFELK
ncbi:BNR-4 repeat-containing protein [Pedobacter sp. SD-b]|uniref:BNR-4 repeat-containing protein n=1 Tax=Pedobacter segetis TaxID=2793069 RepID=A0ABS1BIB1_9SPHI|nr:BNR-4 repeat-containing protein [Pedobacter segetis]MBK0381939.1 BNR-4 repeat-containing protein [Pedobacter segetis]